MNDCRRLFAERYNCSTLQSRFGTPGSLQTQTPETPKPPKRDLKAIITKKKSLHREAVGHLLEHGAVPRYRDLALGLGQNPDPIINYCRPKHLVISSRAAAILYANVCVPQRVSLHDSLERRSQPKTLGNPAEIPSAPKPQKQQPRALSFWRMPVVGRRSTGLSSMPLGLNTRAMIPDPFGCTGLLDKPFCFLDL